MLVRPSLQADEMDRSYLGRVMRLNGIGDKKNALAALRMWGGDDPNPSRGLRTGTLEYLSRLADIPLDKFVAHHTTLPWRRAISPHKVNVEHGGADSASILSISGFRLAREAAYFCPDCVAGDQARLGFSYWRRTHQLPGCQCCPLHGIALAAVKDQWAFVHSPTRYVDSHCSETQDVGDWHVHPLVQRFQEIATALMTRSQPLSTAVVRQVLHRRGQEKGLHVTSGEVRRPLLSDLVRRSFPHDWLAEVFPAVVDSAKGELLNQLDGLFFFSNGASSVEASFIALAILFDSADEALEQLELFEALPPGTTTRRKASPIDKRNIVDAYVRAFGSHGLAAKECGVSPFLAAKNLRALGLPNLVSGRRGRGLATAATAFYVKRLGFTESASLGGIPVAEFESLIRQASPLFAKVLELFAPGKEEAAMAA